MIRVLDAIYRSSARRAAVALPATTASEETASA